MAYFGGYRQWYITGLLARMLWSFDYRSSSTLWDWWRLEERTLLHTSSVGQPGSGGVRICSLDQLGRRPSLGLSFQRPCWIGLSPGVSEIDSGISYPGWSMGRCRLPSVRLDSIS